MGRLRRLLLALVAGACANVACAAPLPAGDLFTLKLLTQDDPALIVAGVKAVERGPASRELADVVAELVEARNAAPVASPRERDLVAWMLRALGASGDARYRATVERAVATHGGLKTDRHGGDALALLAGATAQAYRPGSVDLADVRARVAREWEALPRPPGAFAAARRQGLADVFAASGRPDAIVESTRFSDASPLPMFEIRGVDLLYAGAGLVSMDYRRGEGWVVAEVWRDVARDVAPYAGAHPVEAALLMTSNPKLLKALAARLDEQARVEPALLDRVAARLLASHRAGAGEEGEALRVLCEVLGRGADLRYAPALDHVVRTAADAETRRIARLARAKLQRNAPPA